MNMKCAMLMTLSCLGCTAPAKAAPTTSAGEISVAQVVELIQRSSSETAARNAAMAYLAGVGEATGLLVKKTCARPLGISSEAALAAFAHTEKSRWGQMAATPILVNDMLSRASCR
ncbi:hypothetical protein [Rhizobium oryzicola]|uniref:Chlorophyllide reductase n=1 Tax=Rhizobium oryzicola TaxID=1232668 RepID=A0ABT8SSU0_9HYPH|nr:hypothetical protein [Rhizobium oryzicola]MDO1581456.1 hypothetical protein [Rhizobium oryzicola]